MKTSNQLVDEAKSKIKEISIQDLKSKASNPHIILIDIREPDEYQAGYIEHAVNMPRGVLEMRIYQHPSVLQHCDTLVALEALSQHEIYLICRSGGRSALAALSLQNMGFPHVFSIAGGMQAWQDANFPIVQ